MKIGILNPVIATDYPTIIADQEGFFEKNGIKAELISATQPLTPLLSGDIDVAMVGSAPGLVGIEQGQPLRFIAATVPVQTVALIVKPDSPLIADAHKWPKIMEDLKGKTLGTTVSGAQIDLTARYVVHQAGLGAADVNVVAAGNANTLVAGIRSGSFDAGLVPSPLFETLIANHEGASVLDIYKGEGPKLLFPYASPAVTAAFAKEHPDLVEGYQKAVQEAIDWAKDPANLNKLTNIIAKKLDVDAITLAAPIQTFRGALKTAEYSKAQWSAAIDMMKTNGIVTKNYDYSEYVIPFPKS
jgi:NitT/TauT family transport system substrate-binding protein